MEIEQFDFSALKHQGGYVQINIPVGKLSPTRIKNRLDAFRNASSICKLLVRMNIPFDINPTYTSDTETITIQEEDNNTKILTDGVNSLKDITNIQCSDGNWNYDNYMHGMANGLILASSMFESGRVEFLDAPDEWLKDTPNDEHVLTEHVPVKSSEKFNI